MITCFIEYQLDPSKLALFEQYARNWGEIIPRCGGELVGYFLPHEGTNFVAYGLINFASLAEYEAYRVRLKADQQGRDNLTLRLKSGLFCRKNAAFYPVFRRRFCKE
ncbi:NIPSNAP family protein [Pseudoalteromonas rubra]|uniref:NIPSNAP family protein n=1 Tax=Pseudoalteromonas rubra TaxID=43658 RepID=UPI001F0B8352|nr:NIPSNAP family protein [Pseudoalteromonas rubra]